MDRATRCPVLRTASALLLLGSLALLAGARPAAAQNGAKYVGSEACKDCHDTEFGQFRTNPHGRAAADSALVGKIVGCESCHGPGSLHVAAGGNADDPGFKSIRNLKTMKAADASAVCRTCHTGGEQFYWDHGVHARNDVACVDCHTIHHSKPGKTSALLPNPDINQVCLRCHTDRRAQMARSAHMPLREGGMSCVDCHNPHGSPAPKQLRAASVNDLCYTCHADKRGPMLWEHPPVRENCLNCHDPHGGNNPRMLVSRTPYLCQRCHDGTRHPSSPYDPSALTARSNRLVNRACVNCHANIHGSNHPSGRTFLR
ncbi:MAG TPA: DmsE family decaheme c-type cytochrome [Candidatus Saccharimonadales bacterium]|nr:DmsE family decaheme c-type cytochrome [Candidatus Saccharimonadales bacterium]